MNHCISKILTVSMLTASVQAAAQQKPQPKPNILWIVSEDNSAYYLHCYGNRFATTPNIDQLAKNGFLYTHAYANSPVCAPARNAILTGAYAASNGNEQMRSYYYTSDQVGTYAAYMRQAGYYCTNNDKTDYNSKTLDPKAIWDESSHKAHYKNRPEGKPFFAVFNLFESHESCLHKPIPDSLLRHNLQALELAPYHPDTREIRHDYAQYYDKIEEMDARVGELLKELEESGLADNTIVFYYGDNGGVIARSKRFVFESGTHIPLIVSIPEKYKHLYPANKPGEKIDRLVSFVDLAPTVLSLAGAPIPDYMQGYAFLGEAKTADPEYAFMTRGRMDERYDHSRAVRDKQYRYIRNYMPFRIYGQHISYLYNAPSARSWLESYKAGKCNETQRVFWNTKPVEELYDLENDPWEIHNLAFDPEYKDVLMRMRTALTGWISSVKDVGLIPEPDYDVYAGEKSMYDHMRSSACPFNELVKASELAILGDAKDLEPLIGYLEHENSGIRYWGVTGLLIRKEESRGAVDEIKALALDPSAAVRTLAAETLYGLGETEPALEIYINLLRDTAVFDISDRNFALNSIDAINVYHPELEGVVSELYEQHKDKRQNFERFGLFDAILAEWLLHKWGIINPSDNP